MRGEKKDTRLESLASPRRAWWEMGDLQISSEALFISWSERNARAMGLGVPSSASPNWCNARLTFFDFVL
jgi:hypothetical protein